MLGRRMEQLKEAMLEILDDMDLDENNYISIVTFESKVESWTPFKGSKANLTLPIKATAKHMASAQRFIKKLAANVRGWTNIHGGLEEALRISNAVKSTNTGGQGSKLPPNVRSLIIFLTDGQANVGIHKTEPLLKSIKEKNTEGVPIFSLSFGKQADYNLLQRLSLQNHGFARKIYEDSDTVLQLKNFIMDISIPLLSRVKFIYTSQHYGISETTQKDFDMYFNGKELVVAGKIGSGSSTGPIPENSLQVEIYGTSVNGTTVFKSPTIIDIPTGQRYSDDFMERLWAYLTISQLVALDLAGNSTVEPLTSSEDDMSTSSEEIPKPPVPPKEKATTLALKFRFVTPYTSLVVVVPPSTNSGLNCSCAQKYVYPTALARCPCSTIPTSEELECVSCLKAASTFVQKFHLGTVNCNSSQCSNISDVRPSNPVLCQAPPGIECLLTKNFMPPPLSPQIDVRVNDPIVQDHPTQSSTSIPYWLPPLVRPDVRKHLEYRPRPPMSPTNNLVDLNQTQFSPILPYPPPIPALPGAKLTTTTLAPSTTIRIASFAPSAPTLIGEQFKYRVMRQMRSVALLRFITLSRRSTSKSVCGTSSTANSYWINQTQNSWADAAADSVLKIVDDFGVSNTYRVAGANHGIQVAEYYCCTSSGDGRCGLLNDCHVFPDVGGMQLFLNSTFFCTQHLSGVGFYVGVCCPAQSV